jgi:hypothetical protein
MFKFTFVAALGAISFQSKLTACLLILFCVCNHVVCKSDDKHCPCFLRAATKAEVFASYSMSSIKLYSASNRFQLLRQINEDSYFLFGGAISPDGKYIGYFRLQKNINKQKDEQQQIEATLVVRSVGSGEVLLSVARKLSCDHSQFVELSACVDGYFGYPKNELWQIDFFEDSAHIAFCIPDSPPFFPESLLKNSSGETDRGYLEVWEFQQKARVIKFNTGTCRMKVLPNNSICCVQANQKSRELTVSNYSLDRPTTVSQRCGELPKNFDEQNFLTCFSNTGNYFFAISSETVCRINLGTAELKLMQYAIGKKLFFDDSFVAVSDGQLFVSYLGDSVDTGHFIPSLLSLTIHEDLSTTITQIQHRHKAGEKYYCYSAVAAPDQKSVYALSGRIPFFNLVADSKKSRLFGETQIKNADLGFQTGSKLFIQSIENPNQFDEVKID